MLKALTKLVAAGVLLATFSAPAVAMPVEWTLNNVVFEDGSSLTGSFTYDADTGNYDPSNTTLNCVAICPGGTITEIDDYLGEDGTYYDFNHYYGEQYDYPLVTAFLVWDEDLNAPSSSVVTVGFGDLYYDDGVETQYALLLPGATISSSVVPVPAAVWLFGSAIGVLGWFRGRKTV